MRAITFLLFACAFGFACAMHYFDSRMQKHRAPDAPPSAFRWVPLRWFDSTLYTEAGDVYRKRTLACWVSMLFCFAAAAFAAAAKV